MPDSAPDSSPTASTRDPVKPPLRLLLGSSSRYRQELLNRLGLAFDTARPDIDESSLPGESPKALVTRLAAEKARILAPRHPNHLIIGSDQVASIDDTILGKPHTIDRACAQLAQLSGRTVRFYTGLALLNSASGQLRTTLDVTEVVFRQLDENEIAAYVAAEQPLDCAGSFKSEGLGVALFEGIKTEDPAALIGLPLVQLCALLRAEGINPLTVPGHP